MYRIEWDDEDEPEEPVLYCYELQVCPEYQGKGLGAVPRPHSLARYLKLVSPSFFTLSLTYSLIPFVGKYLLDIIYSIKTACTLPKVMLTCFKINEKALKFYQVNKYVVDANSPSRFGEITDYEILSRK